MPSQDANLIFLQLPPRLDTPSQTIPWPGSLDPKLSYLAEGAANILYRVQTCPRLPDGFQKAIPTSLSQVPKIELGLLRLRKTPLNDAEYNDVKAGHDLWRVFIAPHFAEENLVQQGLIELPGAVIGARNAELQGHDRDGTRVGKRSGVYLDARQEVGLLVTDMTIRGGVTGRELWDPRYAEGLWALEFKPKWLAQSPSAPKEAKRCRTCALRARRAVEAKEADALEMKALEQKLNPVTPAEILGLDMDRDEGQTKSWCPLRLVEEGLQGVRDVLAIVAREQKVNITDAALDRTAAHLVDKGILTRLRDAQVKLDPRGIHKTDKLSWDLRSAMTLRDCSLLMKIPKSAHFGIEARFGDLDLKSGEKYGKWREIEDGLLDKGWYVALERGNNGTEGVCLLADA